MAKDDEQAPPVSSMALAPSQTITSTNRPSANQRKRNRGKKKSENEAGKPANESTSSTTATAPAPAALPSTETAQAASKPAATKKKKNRTKKKKPPVNPDQKEAPVPSKKSKAKRNKNARKRFPWRKHLPQDSVDPITLETLESLLYPPFALCASEPYDPVPEWPVPEPSAAQAAVDPGETEEDRQRRIIGEQWGDTLTDKKAEEAKAVESKPAEKRHYNLFDGRALAYYMVSQLQFIDPLNRRDLTRDELVGLDRYLRQHRFDDLNVTEAYDAKGITISSAGAAANTATGRAAILQQLAGNLLNGLFGGGNSVSQTAQARSTAAASTNQLMAQYQAHEQSVQASGQRRGRQNDSRPVQDTGIYGDAGLMIIDDDMNPGLRGNAPTFVPSIDEDGGSNTMWSASHIASRYGHANLVQQNAFPSLAETAPAPAAASTQASRQQAHTPKKVGPSNKTLSRITKTIKKTNPEELQKQWEAREEARRKAALSNLTFGSNLSTWDLDPNQEIPISITTTTDAVVTEAQLDRNRAFAQALGVAPATLRGNINSGWARPTSVSIERDEFGHELNASVYPDALIIQARERIGPLLKLERKWKLFLDDDKAASLPLNKMERPMRKFVHEYSDFWKLQTESFDPEPKRYIHCVKLRDTSVPYPLLSDAARNWRGPRPLLQSTMSDHASLQTAGQTTGGRDMPAPPERVPLSLKPRSVATDSDAIESLPPGIAISGAPTRTMLEPEATLNSRFGSLAVDRERTKLELAKRTVPLELAPYEQPSKGFDFSEEVQRQKERTEMKARKEREREARKQKALEAAFASSDEEGSLAGDDGSAWSEDEQVPLYAGGDEEEAK